jgi:hypothetical protein
MNQPKNYGYLVILVVGASILACILGIFVIPNWGQHESTETSRTTSSSRSLEDFRIILVPYYSDEYSAEYFVRGNVLIKDNGSNTEVCGPLERIDNNVFEVGVGSNYQHGGKIWPHNAAIFKRNDEKVGRVTDAPYRFAVFDFNENKIYESSSSYGYRKINEEAYLKFKLVEK